MHMYGQELFYKKSEILQIDRSDCVPTVNTVSTPIFVVEKLGFRHFSKEKTTMIETK